MNKLVTIRVVLALLAFIAGITICIWQQLWWELLMLALLVWSNNLFVEDKKLRNEK